MKCRCPLIAKAILTKICDGSHAGGWSPRTGIQKQPRAPASVGLSLNRLRVTSQHFEGTRHMPMPERGRPATVKRNSAAAVTSRSTKGTDSRSGAPVVEFWFSTLCKWCKSDRQNTQSKGKGDVSSHPTGLPSLGLCSLY